MAERRLALQIALAGFGAQVVGFVANALTVSLGSPRIAQACALTMVLGSTLVVWGSIRLARAKGRGWYVGLLGLFSIVGVAIVRFGLADRGDGR